MWKWYLYKIIEGDYKYDKTLFDPPKHTIWLTLRMDPKISISESLARYMKIEVPTKDYRLEELKKLADSILAGLNAAQLKTFRKANKRLSGKE